MKKIEMLNQTEGVKVLSRNELKMITGGSEDGGTSCPGRCGGGDSFPWTAGCKIVILCSCENNAATWSTC